VEGWEVGGRVGVEERLKGWKVGRLEEVLEGVI
jgi:hypothetical protein